MLPRATGGGLALCRTSRALLKATRTAAPIWGAPFPGISAYDDCAISTDLAVKYDWRGSGEITNVTGDRRPNCSSEKNRILEGGREGGPETTADGPSDRRLALYSRCRTSRRRSPIGSDRRFVNNDPTDA